MPFLGNKNKMCYNALTIGNIAHFNNIHFCILVNFPISPNDEAKDIKE